MVFGVQHAFHGDLVSGLYTAADRAGYELALSAVTPARDERRAVASLVQDRCEALILLGPQAPTSSLAELATRLPVVILARAARHRRSAEWTNLWGGTATALAFVGGSGAVAEYMDAGSPPRAITTGIVSPRSAISRRSAAARSGSGRLAT